MELFTKIDIPESNFKIDYNSKIAFIGSCFAENISGKFAERKFHTLINPLGIIYNPLSIENMMEKIEDDTGKPYSEKDVFFDGESWSSWDAHGSLSVKGNKDDESARTECVSMLNKAISESRHFLSHADAVFITLGTAYVYFLKETGIVVSNCHKQNAALFERRLITVEEAAEALTHTVESLRKIKSDIRIIFTVSPLRHLNDGAHGNNLSKSTLLLAIEKVKQKFAEVSYFPSYEIVMDELRDYRFYAEDMVHLSKTAEEYIFERMCAIYCTEATIANMKRIEKFMRTVNHRIIDSDSVKTKALAEQQIKKAKELEVLIPGLDLKEEQDYFQSLVLR